MDNRASSAPPVPFPGSARARGCSQTSAGQSELEEGTKLSEVTDELCLAQQKSKWEAPAAHRGGCRQGNSGGLFSVDAHGKGKNASELSREQREIARTGVTGKGWDRAALPIAASVTLTITKRTHGHRRPPLRWPVAHSSSSLDRAPMGQRRPTHPSFGFCNTSTGKIATTALLLPTPNTHPPSFGLGVFLFWGLVWFLVVVGFFSPHRFTIW